MDKSSNAWERHQQSVDALVRRLLRKGANGTILVGAEYGPEGQRWRSGPYGELDVLHEEFRNGRQYLTYYEVKTGENGQAAHRKAWQQAQTFFKRYPAQPGAHKTVVYVHPLYGVERWKE